MKKLLQNRKTALYLLCAVFLFWIDRYLKYFSLQISGNYYYELIGEWLFFRFTPNPNIAFSLPFSGEWLNYLILLIIFTLVSHVFSLIRRNDYRLVYLFFMILFGAVSNLYDRFKYGFVVDYFEFKYFSVFNIADMMIVGGVLGVIWFLIQDDRTKRSLDSNF